MASQDGSQSDLSADEQEEIRAPAAQGAEEESDLSADESLALSRFRPLTEAGCGRCGARNRGGVAAPEVLQVALFDASRQNSGHFCLVCHVLIVVMLCKAEVPLMAI
jgi:hypothetical protein